MTRSRPLADWEFEYFGIKTVYDRYLLRHPSTRLVIETPQYFLLRVACGLSRTAAEAIGFYRMMSSLAYLPSSPTLFNSGTSHPQMSSCFLVDSPRDDLGSIYDRYAQVARLSKFSGGIGIAWSRVRSRGALIRGTNGASNGIVPFLRTLDASVAAVNQGGRRKGAACVYLEPWHPDIEEFLELQGQHRRGGAAHPQPQPGQLDPGRVHAPGRSRRAVVADRPGRGARPARPVGRRRSTPPTGRPRRPAATCGRSGPATCTAR